MTSETVIERFNQGEKFVNQKGQRVIAVAKHEIGPALICGEDEDTIGVKFEGVDYYSPEDRSDDFWDVTLATDLKAVKE